MRFNSIFLILALLITVVAVDNVYADIQSKGNSDAVTRIFRATDQDLLYDQFDSIGANCWTAQNFETDFDAYDSEMADDFTIPAGEQWTIEQVLLLGVYYNCAPCGPAASVHITFYNDAAGMPGTVAAGPYDIVPTLDTLGSYILDVTAAPILTEGPYWVGVYVNMDYLVGGQWGWCENDILHGYNAMWQNPGGGFLTGCATWGVPATCFADPTSGPDFLFQLYGASEVTVDPCSDYTSFLTRCTASGMVQARAVLRDNIAHSGEMVTFQIDETLYMATIGDNGVSSRASISISGLGAGDHAVSLVDPPSCFDPRVVTCLMAKESANQEWEADEARWAAESRKTETQATPTATKLLGNYPNPFNPTTAISYQLSADNWVALRIYNTLGEEVATLVNEFQTAGYKSATWNGRNDAGSSVASGIYIYRLTTGNVVKSEKMMFMK